jgi:hypothetical protein
MAVIPGEKGAAKGGQGFRTIATKTAAKTSAAKSTNTTPEKQTAINWDAILGSDQSLQAAITQANTANDLAHQGMLGTDWQTFIAYGGVPALDAQYNQNPQAFLAAYGATPNDLIPDWVRQAADQATQAHTSTLAQISDAYQLANNTANANLAGRGLAHSGGVLQAAEQDARARDISSSNALNTVLGSLGQAAQGYQNTVSQNSTALDKIIAGITAGQYGSGTTSTASPSSPRPASPAPKTPTAPVKLTGGPALSTYGTPGATISPTAAPPGSLGGRLPL